MIYSWWVWRLQHNTVVCIHCTIGLIYYSLQVWRKPGFDCRLVGHSLIWGYRKSSSRVSPWSKPQSCCREPGRWPRDNIAASVYHLTALHAQPGAWACFCSLLFVDKDSNTRHHLWENDLQIRGNTRSWKNLIPRREMLTKAELPFGE